MMQLQIVSPRADNAYSGRVLEVDDRAYTMTMFRRVPIRYVANLEDPISIEQDTFTRKRIPLRDGLGIEVLADEQATPGDIINHLLARDCEFRHWEDKYSYYFDSWRQYEKAEAEKKFMEAAHESPVT